MYEFKMSNGWVGLSMIIRRSSEVGRNTLSLFLLRFSFDIIPFPLPSSRAHNVIDKTSADFLSAHSLVTHYRASAAISLEFPTN